MAEENTTTKKRDLFLDSMKGLCVIAIILIHTVFHSCYGFSPAYIKDIVLLFDVPIFFFATGCLMSIKPDLDPFKQMLKLIWLFFVLTFVGELVTGTLTLKNLLEPLTLTSAFIEPLRSVAWSYWFVPAYIVCLFYTTMITRYTNNFVINILLILIPLYYIYSWFTGNISEATMLGLSFQQGVFFVWLMLLGWQTYKSDRKLPWLLVSIFTLIALAIMYKITPNLALQDCKFPLKLPYCIASMISIGILMFVRKPVNSKIIQFVGNKAIYFYLSQGVGASILFFIVPYLNMHWTCKLMLAFIINLAISLSLGYVFYMLDKYSNKLPNLVTSVINKVKNK